MITINDIRMRASVIEAADPCDAPDLLLELYRAVLGTIAAGHEAPATLAQETLRITATLIEERCLTPSPAQSGRAAPARADEPGRS